MTSRECIVRRHRFGFSLVELLVAMGIFAVLAGVVLVNFRRSQYRDAARFAALQFAADVERMQAAALAGSAERSGAVAYGVHVQEGVADRYVLFADLIQCVSSGSGECTANRMYDAGEELADGIRRLPDQVRIQRVLPAAQVDMAFAVPGGFGVIVPEASELRVEFAHRALAERWAAVVNAISGRSVTFRVP
ncbi:prepilin-type N-terminal cleavage/methylation domain-containing protein [Candidatus Uhrbacteria bacterium]|nr:prepilin-type N-terminal cleavage/methylation domain-containing protein [Candidatus Uhrbacteria bacterium]